MMLIRESQEGMITGCEQQHASISCQTSSISYTLDYMLEVRQLMSEVYEAHASIISE
jgi:hypothetical protein